MNEFTHLHVHTQYSILDGASGISELIVKAKEYKMKALAITDHGNMFGVKKFYDTAIQEGIKPILGCEVYVAKKSRLDKKDKQYRSGYHLILLAKNKTGYHNLIKLVSIAWIDGHYYKPRVDKELLRKYNEGIIATSACMAGEVSHIILNEGEEKAEKVILEYKEIFGDDFYLELLNHSLEEQEKVNEVLIRLSKKLDVKLIATNDVHFVNQEDAYAQDILLCLNTGKDYDDKDRLRYTGQEYFKSPDEMYGLFPGIPEALENTNEIADKVETYELNREVVLPDFPVPEEFKNQDDYLRDLTYQGANAHYPELTEEIKDRLEYELSVIKDMGFAGYFLIIQNVLNAARDMGVSIGPGRGSVAGSAVAFCINITDIDPIKYDLLFERFLNPERISMPDIDIDFDEDGRDDVIKWVTEKYGADRVAQIVTFGTMRAKNSIRDVARVIGLPLSEANMLSKLVPEKQGTTLQDAYKEVPELAGAKNSDNTKIKETLKFAEILEGNVRQTSLHACGVIIGRDDLIEHIPLTISKDTKLLVTQYEMEQTEKVGLLKMDFLGLKTLSIIKDAVKNIEQSKQIKIDIKSIPLDDPKTLELYQKGETIGTFQFESPNMRAYLKELRPTSIEDLIAMTSLYRPGPMEYIPKFIKRKQGKEKIEYPHEMLEEILKDTYGIMVYQEQIMKIAQIMGGFTMGKADTLRKAMGKKKMDIMKQQKAEFIESAEKKQVESKKAENIFDDMAKFAGYGFNRSHAAGYTILAFRTAYLKANHPAEYMAAVLSRNLSNIKEITIFMDECKRMGLPVLGPDINESNLKFNVNKNQELRFGLGAIKGVGEKAAISIIEERNNNGNYKDIYNLVERVNLHSVNKTTVESLTMAGAFDNFNNIKRSPFFAKDKNDISFIEAVIKYGNKIQDEKYASPTLFEGTNNIEVSKPKIPECEEWTTLEKLNKEKDLIGIYLSAHPLDVYRFEINNLCNTTLSEFNDMKKLNKKEIIVAGIVNDAQHKTTKTGNPYGTITIEDFTDSYKLFFFSKDYLNLKNYFTSGYSLLLKGKIQPKYNSDELEFKVNSINILSEIRKEIKSISLKIPLAGLTEEIGNELFKLADSNKGKTLLKFQIYDTVENVNIEMFSRTHHINLSDNFIDYLENNSGIDYKIK